MGNVVATHPILHHDRCRVMAWQALLIHVVVRVAKVDFAQKLRVRRVVMYLGPRDVSGGRVGLCATDLVTVLCLVDSTVELA